MVAAAVNGLPGLLIAATDGSGVRPLDLKTPAIFASWRPSSDEILYMDAAEDGQGSLVVVDVDTGITRTILRAGTPALQRGHPQWSPDGSLISYGEWTGMPYPDVQVHLIKGDGSPVRTLPTPKGDFQAPESWSNDGTRLLAARGSESDSEPSRLVVLPVDGSGSGIEIKYPGSLDWGDPVTWEWAPDDSSILGTPLSGDTPIDQILVDPVAGTSRTPSWTSVSLPSWQRLAP